ncbi:MAG: class I SAM-dependent methyltransferase [Rhodothermales bacterium]|nr:class I SAM-dependent methyltransferase [Rhodothermales bacterium]
MGTKGAARTQAFIQEVAAGVAEAAFEVTLWDGTSFDSVPGKAPRFRLHLRREDALRRMLAWPTDRSICEAYIQDVYDLEGDMDEVFAVAEALGRDGLRGRRASAFRRFLGLPRAKGTVPGAEAAVRVGRFRTREGDQAAIAFHYDVSNEFYAAWLDSRMVYSGAYYTSEDQSLEDAQLAKLNHICQALRLKPGDRMLDIGCGFGALAIHAAQHFEARVLGVTLSERQAAYANSRIEELGLSERCEVRLQDYRDLAADGSYDAVSSIEMLHHVPEADVPAYFAHTSGLLKPGGRSLHLAITTAPGNTKQPRFSRAYFMPDVSLVTLSTYLQHAEEARFDILSVRGLREQYRLTARAWLERLEAAHDLAVREVGESRYRVWRLSIALMAHAFRTSALRFHHLVIQKRGGVVDLTLPIE